MPACFFCKQNYEFPRGTTVVGKEGTPRHFCSSKCRKSNDMGRLSKKVKWIVKSDIVKEEKKRKQASYEARLEAKKVEAEAKAARKTKKK